MRYKTLVRLTWFLLALTLTIKANSSISSAQLPVGQWVPQARIPNYDDLIDENPPYLITDQNRTVHAFNSQTIDGEGPKAIMYRQWTLEEGWTTPIDIFFDHGGDIEVLDVFLDKTNKVHIVFVQNRELYYSNAPLVSANQASSWMIPTFVSEQLSSPFNAGLDGDDKGNLVIVFGSIADRAGISVVYSADDGVTWSERPESVFVAYGDDVSVLGIQVYTGQSGQLHAVWSVVNTTGQGESVQYAKLDIENRTWSDTIVLGTPEENAVVSLGVFTPAVIEYNGVIIVAYYSGNVNGNWWRQSVDGGQTWTDPIRISSRHVGTNGAVSFVVDSSDTLHLFFGQRINDLNHGMWHSIWQGGGWSLPLPVVSGPQVRDVVGGNGFDPRSARAVISQGNVILVTWATDGIAGQNGAWYSYTTLDTPELPVIALPTPVPPTATPVIAAVASDLVTPTATPIRLKVVSSEQYEDITGVTSNTSIPLFLGVVPVLLFILIVIALQLYQFNHR